MLRRYVQMDEEDAECQLGVDMAADVVTCEVPFGSVLFLNNLIPHRWPEFLSKDHLGYFSWKTVVPRSTHACLAHPACIGEMGECKEMPCTEQLFCALSALMQIPESPDPVCCLHCCQC